MNIRTVLRLVVSAFAALAAPLAPAQPYPSKPVTAIVPFPPGGPLDFVARVVGEKMAASLGQPIVVENRAGAFGNIGAQAVARAAPDGYTLLWVVDATVTSNPAVYGNVGFDPLRDFAPVAMVTESASALVIHPSVPAANVAELIALAKKQPLAYASGGNGSPGQLIGELFKLETGAPMTHVPYKGNAPAVQSIVAGQTQVFFSSIPGIVRQVAAGKLKALAVASAERSPYLPGVPTLAESGVNVKIKSWFALLAPARTPQAIVERLYREAQAAVKDPAVSEKLTKQGLDAVVAPPDELAARMRSDTEKWTRVVREAKITAQ
jgi:tripartite-type tricarboxylate transporter receptor subunit TctC